MERGALWLGKGALVGLRRECGGSGRMLVTAGAMLRGMIKFVGNGWVDGGSGSWFSKDALQLNYRKPHMPLLLKSSEQSCGDVNSLYMPFRRLAISCGYIPHH